MNYISAVHTDVGIKKKLIRIQYLLKLAATDYGQVLLGVICDGMGGLAKGEVASAIINTKAFAKWFHIEFPKLLYTGIDPNRLRESWTKLILEQNKIITDYGLDCNVSLGTTVVALLLIDNLYYAVNVGDSRVYLMKEDIQQITVDQTVVQREMELGRMTPEQARKSPQRNVLLQCVGASSVIEPDFYVGEVIPDSIFMMCSDGFRHVITPEEFFQRLNPQVLTTQEIMKESAVYFTELNKKRREEDNISVALIRAY